MPRNPTPAMSHALFSLATGLEVADGQRVLEAVGRAKMASILFDEIIVESGLHVVEMSSAQLPIVRRQTAASISPSLLERSRKVERGTKAGMAIRSSNDGQVELYVGTNLPRLDDASYFEHDIAFRYVSEYHSGMLDELAELNADWVRVIQITGFGTDQETVTVCPLTVLPREDSADEPFAVLRLDADEAMRLGNELLKESSTPTNEQPLSPDEAAAVTPHERVFAELLTEAIRIGRQLGATPTISTAFKRVALDRGVSIRLPGEESLGVLLPNFSLLPWQAIAEFRDHPGAVEARGRLREFETTAASNEPQRSVELARKTGQAITNELLGVAKALAPSLPDKLRAPIIGSAVSLVPVVGQYASLAVSMGDLIATLRGSESFQQSWVAAILELRDASLESLMDF